MPLGSTLVISSHQAFQNHTTLLVMCIIQEGVTIGLNFRLKRYNRNETEIEYYEYDESEATNRPGDEESKIDVAVSRTEDLRRRVLG